MAEELKIVIGADVDDLKKGVSEAEKSLSAIRKPAEQTGKAFAEIGKQSKTTASDIAKLQPAAGGAGNVLTNLSRVASDAPFGFIAIQNNLEPLIQSFGSLQQQSGGTGAALKSLAASLAGPAGLAVGFSVVSALITTTIQKYGSLTNAIDLFLTAGSEQVKQFQQLNALRKDALEDASEEIARLDVLTAVAQDVTNSTENRAEAARKLVQVYGEYLPNIKEEEILNNRAAEAINKAKDAILNKALAAAAERKVAEIGQQLLDVQLKQVDAQKNLNDLRNQRTQGFSTEEFINAENDAIVRAQGAVSDLNKEYQALQNQYTKLITLAQGFAKQAGDAFIQDEPIKNLRKEIEKIPKRIPPIVVPIKIERATITQGIEDADNQIQNAFKLQEGLNIPLSIDVPSATFEKLKQFGENARQALDFKKFKEDAQLLAGVLTQVFSPAIDQLFNELGSGKKILQTLGESVKQFVIGAIKQFVKLAAISGIISLVTGVPFSAAFKTVAGGGGSGFFGGGFGGTAPIGGVSSGGFAVNVGGQFNLRGTDLVASIAQANQRIGRVG